ncbi:GNAT family N-acetyltransferase [Sediminibacillus dalangtanensis]|uniref:GNAT family N-acetyltransferase n=1 Tax=Sediminibacillus dalangtanensis TaxID=2729421 RepID=A0ABX7VWS7_9BACI|nr:GNAT family protein [Sediminibacillus dalangtanensis]QTN01423.1 GNAT family N-acetyltransferase [Sediminibacillus dalangtanensis]
MTQRQAEEIAYKWHYPGEYSFYDMEADEEDLEEFLDADQRGDDYYVVEKNDQLIGFFNFHQKQNGKVEIGLGMKPECTGKGRGLDFLRAGLELAIKTYCPSAVTLSVAAFNKRAIRLYQKAGFVVVGTFIQNTNGGSYDFVSMEWNPRE